MAYEGPGVYEHYKGGRYEVLGPALKEDTVVKADAPDAGPEVQLVIYRPLTPGSLLELREEDFWARERSDFDAEVEVPWGSSGVLLTPRWCLVPRFQKLHAPA